LEDCLNECMPAKTMYFRLPSDEFQKRTNDTASVVCVLKEEDNKTKKLACRWDGAQWRATLEGELPKFGKTLMELAMQFYFTDSQGMMGPLPGVFKAFVAPVFKGFK